MYINFVLNFVDISYTEMENENVKNTSLIQRKNDKWPSCIPMNRNFGGQVQEKEKRDEFLKLSDSQNHRKKL